MRWEASVSVLTAGLLGLAPALGWAQEPQRVPNVSDHIFFPLPPVIAIPLAIVAVILGAYAYHKDRLTPLRVVATALAIMALLAMPRLVNIMLDWTW